ATLAPLGEVRVDTELVVQIHVGAEPAVEEVRLVEAEIDELANPAELRLQREALPVAEQVGLLDLRRCDEVLEARKARADLERPGRLLHHLDVDVHPIERRTLLGRDVDALEVAERRDAPAGAVEARLAERLAFGDFELAADHLVARLRVAAHLDAPEANVRTAHDGHD